MPLPPQRLVISEIMSGQQTYEKPFFVNNDSFPFLQNAVCWRKSVRKKQGSQLLGQLQRQIGTTGASPFTVTISPVPLVHGVSQFTIGSVVLVDGDITGGAVATLTSSNSPSYTGTLNRTTGLLMINIPAIPATPVFYNPGMPVMGIEEFESDKSASTQIDFPINVFFDQTYSYQFNGTNFYDVSFYKGTTNPVYWTGADYQQFFSCNYYRAMFVTNNNPGMQFKVVTGMPVVGPVSQFTVTGHGLTNSDFVFINEIGGVTNVNGVSGKITVIDPNTFSLATPGAAGAFSSNGIAQYLTNLVAGNGDGIRWYDGDPNFFQGKGIAPGSPSGLGWVNFAPPLDNLQSSSTTYLMGARMILPFGNRLLAFGTFEATSANASNPTYYGNRIRYCEVNATPFYSLPVPATDPAGFFEPNAWVSNIQGFGGFVDLDTTERIISAAVTQGSLILGLESEQRKLVNTGIETQPYFLEVINPEYGSAGTYGIIPMDHGILTVGEYGFLTTSSYDSKRFDEKIIDQVFQINQSKNGYDRICGARDFVNEVVYFTYYSDSADANNKFPDTTVVFNYREGSFGVWYETFTTYGIYKNSTTEPWEKYFIPWENWNVRWEDLGPDRFSKPFVAAGTPQGYVMLKWSDISFNQPSAFIHAIVDNGDDTFTITSPNHNFYQGQFLGFWPGVPSSSVDKQNFNGVVKQVTSINQFIVEFGAGATPASIVPGIWQISVVDVIDILSKQFPAAWAESMKTRIGAQKYFLDTTTSGEFTLNIYGSQSTLALDGPGSDLAIFTSIVRTKPDQSLGLNDSASYQEQIWHRLSSSAIGDTIQLQFTLSQDQMLAINADGTPNVEIGNSPWVLYSIILDLYPSRVLA